MANVISGQGDRRIASDLYEGAILNEVATMRREGVFVCLGHLQLRMGTYNQEMLVNTFWALCIQGKI
jgi:hypothetical protein